MPVNVELDESCENIWIESSWRWKDQIKTIPGTKWSNDRNMWRVPVSWSACLAMRTTFDSELVIGKNLTDWAIKERISRIDPCLELRNASSYDEGDPSLYWWQRSGAEFIKTGKRVLIADDPGAGKSATTIRGMHALKEEGEEIFPMLIVAPSAMKKTWERELIQWWPEEDKPTIQVVKGTAAQRKKQINSGADVLIMNYESVKSHSRLSPYGSLAFKRCPEHGGEDPKVKPTSCQVHVKELNNIDFQTVVVDECHKIKDGKSQQTRAIKAAAGKAPNRVALSGTPTANDVTDLWSILNFLDPEEFPSKTRWIERYCETMLNIWGGMIVLGIKAERRTEFDGMLNPRMRRMSEDVILDFLPPIVYERRDCEMSPKQAKAYKNMKDNSVAEMEDGSRMVAGSPLIQSMRLSQFASSYAELETQESVDEHGFPVVKQKAILTEPSAKLDSFMSDIESFGDNQVAVMAVSKQLIDLLSVRLEKKEIKHGKITGGMSDDDKQEALDDFQNGKTKFILFTAGAGGTGITLTAARYLCRLQLPYSFVDYKQTLRRVRRIGSERHENIIVIDYVTEGTIDENVFEIVAEKEESFEDVVKDKDALIRMLDK